MLEIKSFQDTHHLRPLQQTTSRVMGKKEFSVILNLIDCVAVNIIEYQKLEQCIGKGGLLHILPVRLQVKQQYMLLLIQKAITVLLLV